MMSSCSSTTNDNMNLVNTMLPRQDSDKSEPEPQGYNLKQVLKIDVYSRKNFPHSLRHVRPLLLCPLLRDRGSPLHRVLNIELSIPRFATFLSIVHVIRRRRAHQVIDCVSVFQVYDTRLIRCTPLYHFSKCDRLNCGSKALTHIILHL